MSKVAKMGSNDSKYGQQRSEIERGDRVQAGMAWQHEGVAVKVTAREIVVKTDAGQMFAFHPQYVRLADA